MPHRTLGSKAMRHPSFWRLLLRLPQLLRLIGRLFRDHRVPVSGKLVFVLSIAYFLMPFDLIPDFIQPLIGHIDDIAVLLAGLRFLLRQTPPNLLEEHLAQIR
jgi:uncharacterized membrane protein YkvA (DUF1232 family)